SSLSHRSNMKSRNFLFLPVVAIFCLAARQSGEFWQKAEYTHWSERECRKLLDNSPWAQIYTLSQTLIEPVLLRLSTTSSEARSAVRSRRIAFSSLAATRKSRIAVHSWQREGLRRSLLRS